MVAATADRFDSLAVETGGDVAVAAITHGVAVVTTEGQVEHVAMPDPMVTNICFDRTTAYVTLSGRGALGVLEWPRPGLGWPTPHDDDGRAARRRDDTHTALLTGSTSVQWSDYVQACADRASLLADLRTTARSTSACCWTTSRVPHVARRPPWPVRRWSGSTPPGGAELARDIRHTDCRLIVTEGEHRSLLDGLDTGVGAEQVVDTDDAAFADLLAPHQAAGVPEVEIDPGALPAPLHLRNLGSTQAVIVSQPRLRWPAPSSARDAAWERAT